MIDEKSLERTLKKETYQVFLCTCPCSFPLTFASHPWFVVNKKGVISRYAVNHRRNVGEKKWGHLTLNFKPPFHGLPFLHFYPRAGHFKTTILKCAEGGEDSLAKRLALCIENSSNTYEHLHTYRFVGPNSNTYVQWVLQQFPDLNVQLPWNAFGKGFSHK